MFGDIINSLFEVVCGFFAWQNVYQLYKDKEIKGVHWLPGLFFSLWGWWSLYYYNTLNQFFSFVGAINLTAANTIWLIVLWYFYKKEKIISLT